MSIKRRGKVAGLRSISVAGGAPTAHGDRRPTQRGPAPPAVHVKKAKKPKKTAVRKGRAKKPKTAVASSRKKTGMTDAEWLLFLQGLMGEVLARDSDVLVPALSSPKFQTALNLLIETILTQTLAKSGDQFATVIRDALLNNRAALRDVVYDIAVTAAYAVQQAQLAQQNQPGSYQRMGGF
jgi:hypothetical protein